MASLHIVGGAYRERCLRPPWVEIYGSGGRAVSAVAALGVDCAFSCFASDEVEAVLSDRSALEGFNLTCTTASSLISFDYDHGLSTPRISGVGFSTGTITRKAECSLRFGMLEGEGIVQADQAVYDPQHPIRPRPFAENGSTAKRLAVVLNQREATLLGGGANGMSELARNLRHAMGAQAIVIKRGARGAIVLDGEALQEIPAYESKQVWKIGSGDTFAANFAVRWMTEGRTAAESADLASRATAYYCETRGFIVPTTLETYAPTPLRLSARCVEGYKPQVYLAGPFFTLAQLWLVEQARRDLLATGLRVFSPYHDVGLGSAEDVVQRDLKGLDECDVVFSIGDGMDPGTVFEIGYARARGIPVLLYSETESPESCKMMHGTDCLVESDYVTAIYKTSWLAHSL